jgi:hypothetical protein
MRAHPLRAAFVSSFVVATVALTGRAEPPRQPPVNVIGTGSSVYIGKVSSPHTGHFTPTVNLEVEVKNQNPKSVPGVEVATALDVPMAVPSRVTVDIANAPATTHVPFVVAAPALCGSSGYVVGLASTQPGVDAERKLVRVTSSCTFGSSVDDPGTKVSPDRQAGMVYLESLAVRPVACVVGRTRDETAQSSFVAGIMNNSGRPAPVRVAVYDGDGKLVGSQSVTAPAGTSSTNATVAVPASLGRLSVKLEADGPTARVIVNYGMSATLTAMCQYTFAPPVAMPTGVRVIR